jgi:hypothetical protein
LQCINEDVMAKKHGSKWNIEEMTDPDIYDAILYLESDPQCRKQHNDDTAFVIWFCLVILLLGFLGFMCLYYR